MKVRLNQRAVDNARYKGPGGCYLWDTVTRGFGLRIYPTGRKSYVITYSAKGRQRFYTLGRHDEMTLPEARTEALSVIVRARTGEDPSGARLAARQAPTVSDLADRFIEEHARIKKKARNVKRDRRAWDRCILPRLGRRKVADIDRADVAKLVAEMSSTPAMANKVISLLSKAFNLAEIWGWRPEGTNPCRHVSRYREESRERYLSEKELGRLGDVLAEAERARGVTAHAVAAIRLLILTGCRSAEILTLRWEDIDFERRCLRLPDSKTGRRTIVLNSGALQILDDLERIEGNPYVIPGQKPRRHLSALQPLWKRIRSEAGIEDVRIHDLRHTYASFGVNAGHNLSVIGKLLGHSKILTTQRYAHVADHSIRRANEMIGADLEATLSGGSKAVTPTTQRHERAAEL